MIYFYVGKYKFVGNINNVYLINVYLMFFFFIIKCMLYYIIIYISFEVIVEFIVGVFVFILNNFDCIVCFVDVFIKLFLFYFG